MATPINGRKRKQRDKKEKKASKTKATSSDTPVNSSDEQFTFFFRKGSPFSQWHPAEFTVDGVKFSCAEQFMMYQKAILFNDQEMAQEILATDDPRQHKAFGRKVRNFEKAVWDKNCQILVKKGNLAKFGQNPDLWQKLKATEGTTLVEASPFDRIWGIGMAASNPKASNRKTWRGRNLLGEILTQVREEINKSDPPQVVAMDTAGGCSKDVTTDKQCSVKKTLPDTTENEIPELPPPTIKKATEIDGKPHPNPATST